MPIHSPTRPRVRLTVVSLLSVITTLAAIGVVAVSAGTETGMVLLLGVVLTDLLHEYSPDTPDSGEEPPPPEGPAPDLDTDALLIDAWRDNP